jgi:hypothetical protein
VDTIATISDLHVIPFADAGSRQILFSDTSGGQQRLLSANWTARRAVKEHEEPTANTMPKAIVSNWTRLFFANLSSGLYSRIMQIARRPDGWRGEGSKGLTAEALRAWLDFWAKVNDSASEPSLALTARGTLHAEWFRNSRRHLDLEFVSRARIFFGLFNGHATCEGVDTLEGLVPWLGDHRAHPLSGGKCKAKVHRQVHTHALRR